MMSWLIHSPIFFLDWEPLIFFPPFLTLTRAIKKEEKKRQRGKKTPISTLNMDTAADRRDEDAPPPRNSATPPPAPVPAPKSGGPDPSASQSRSDGKKSYRKKIPPARQVVYPVFQRHSNPNLLPAAQRVHASGFRLLSKGSPIERALTTYFRLPPRAPARINFEHQKLETQVNRLIRAEERQISSRRVLDGFTLLDVTKAPAPSQAREAVINNSNICGVVDADMAKFSNLTFLDLGENCLSLMDLAPLLNLEELHLHCNSIHELEVPVRAPPQRSLAESDDEEEEEDGDENESSMIQPLSRLHTLNLAFNSIRSASILSLSVLPALERLDLSSNGLHSLPTNLSALTKLRQFGLEGNKFAKAEVFHSLATLPALVEVNLSRNQLTCVPRIQEGGFPMLEVLGLATNKVEYFEDLYPLTQLHSLKCIVLFDNPIERRRKDKEILLYEFNAIGVEIKLDPLVPPKRNVGAFYVANTANFVKVKDFKKNIRNRSGKGQPTSPGATDQGKPTEEAHQAPGDTFFMTQGNIATKGGAQAQFGGTGQDPQASAGGITTFRPVPQGGEHGEGVGHVVDSSWLGGNWVDPVNVGSSSHGVSQQRFAARGGSQAQKPASARSVDDVARAPARADVSFGGLGGGTAEAEEQHGFLPDIHEPRGSLRSTLTELKRMLRQPLPPLSTARFASSTKK
jgi:hypothetical protein